MTPRPLAAPTGDHFRLPPTGRRIEAVEDRDLIPGEDRAGGVSEAARRLGVARRTENRALRRPSRPSSSD
jgi:hypothetical protein